MQNVRRGVKKYALVSVPITALSNQTKFMFDDQPLLRGKKIVAIELPAMNYNDLGVPCVNCDVVFAPISYVTFFFGGKDAVLNMPLLELKTTEAFAGASISNLRNFGGLIPWAGQQITWTKCYVTLATAVPVGSDSCFVFGVFYQD